MIRNCLRAATVIGAAIMLTGCVVAGPPGPGPGCPPGTHWVHGFYGAYGVWHPPHCAPI
jgi:hypothetical protein